jgi:CO dehydrogenase maturation factor
MAVIAVTGKGGTGKTVISALLIDHFSTDRKVLAVDADPDSNLPEAVGIKDYSTLGEIRELFQQNRDSMGTISKEQWLEGKIYGEAVNESKHFDLIVMGKPEGEGCYCFVNNLLRSVLRKLMKNYDVVVVDCEAGLEQFSRKTVENADYILIVTDTSKKGLATAKRIIDSTEELKLNFKNIYLVGNKVNSNGEGNAIKQFAEKEGIIFLGNIPYSEKILELDFRGEPITKLLEDTELNNHFREIFKGIGGINDH